MILASHNTMTYLHPKEGWMKIFKPIYQCQRKNILQQLEEGVRYFDIRISFDEFNNPEFRHGLVAFKGDVSTVLSILNNQSEKIICRVVLEKINSILDDLDIRLFQLFCQKIQEKYSNIRFTCGEYKKTKQVLYDFNTFDTRPIEQVVEMYGSVRGKWLEKIFPKLYAKRNNQKLIEMYKNVKKYLMIDFI